MKFEKVKLIEELVFLLTIEGASLIINFMTLEHGLSNFLINQELEKNKDLKMGTLEKSAIYNFKHLKKTIYKVVKETIDYLCEYGNLDEKEYSPVKKNKDAKTFMVYSQETFFFLEHNFLTLLLDVNSFKEELLLNQSTEEFIIDSIKNILPGLIKLKTSLEVIEDFITERIGDKYSDEDYERIFNKNREEE